MYMGGKNLLTDEDEKEKVKNWTKEKTVEFIEWNKKSLPHLTKCLNRNIEI